MLTGTEREKIWSDLNQDWDLIIIGGGVTGAGILREATRRGLRALLVEQRDFAWGTSSRSSKLVHGGLRYLKEGDLYLTHASVQERKRLLREAPGLVKPLGFLWAIYEDDKLGRWTMEAGLSFYDMLARQWGHRFHNPNAFQFLAPRMNRTALNGGFNYGGEAQTDDARLVLRLIFDAMREGGTALNYAKVEGLCYEADQVVGVRLCDEADKTADPIEVQAKVVINATGAWADKLRRKTDQQHIRPLRGSHLVFPGWRVPVAQAVSFAHPLDQRPVFLIPWEGVTLLGTTDVDHQESLNKEPRISANEVAYLMSALEARYPALNLTLDDVIASYAGVRPVLDTGQNDPSKESRDHVVWLEDGLLTVTGGKLTTFRLIALDVLNRLQPVFADSLLQETIDPTFEIYPAEKPPQLTSEIWQRLCGRYGQAVEELITTTPKQELTLISGCQTLWAELRWAARKEGVLHLDDLLLRRTRLGLLLSGGGEAILPQLRTICQAELGWDDHRWQHEVTDYLALWQKHYSLPERETIPDWRPMLAKNRAEQAERVAVQQTRRQNILHKVMAGSAAGLVAGLAYFLSRGYGLSKSKA